MSEREKTRREIIRDTIDDLVSDFLYYDRKEDEDLPRDAVNEAVASGEVTIAELVDWFRDSLTGGLA
jgi:hypothetical protein